MTATAALWLAVVASGLWHGVNPGMGWPLAVSAGLMGRGRRDLLAALGPMAVGHLLAMLGVLLPFALIAALLDWTREIRLGASVIVVGGGVILLLRRRHPRALSRIPPHRLALWSFAIATAHGAGLMLLPIFLGLCGAEEGADHLAAARLMSGDVGMAVLVSVVHAVAMVAAGGAMALLAHDLLGLGLVSRSWLNLDGLWALSLMGIGLVTLVLTLATPG